MGALRKKPDAPKPAASEPIEVELAPGAVLLLAASPDLAADLAAVRDPGVSGHLRLAARVRLIEAGVLPEPTVVPAKVIEPAPQGLPPERPKGRPGVGGMALILPPGYDPARKPGATQEWEEPDFVPALPAPPFPLEVLPAPLAELARAAAIALPCPTDFVAGPALVAAGGAIGRSLLLMVKESWFETASLYYALCAPPGSAKSEALRIATEPINREHSRDLFDYAVERQVAKETKRLREAECRARGAPLDTGDDAAPALRRVRVGDTTTEKLAVILSENPRGVVMIHDELTSWISAMNQYKGGSGADRQFYLSVWSGASISIDRKSQTDGVPVHVEFPFLSIEGAATPDKLPDLNPGGRDDGFLDRILFSYPEPVKVRFSTLSIDAKLRTAWSDAVGRLYTLPLVEDGQGGHKPRLVRFSRAALTRYGQWFDAHCQESESIDFPRNLVGPWAKLRGYCARICLILDALRWAYDGDPDAPPALIEVDVVEKAVLLMDYFKAHISRAHQVIQGGSQENPDAGDLLRWAIRRGKPDFTLREAKDTFKRRFRGNAKGLHAAIHWLCATGAIRLLNQDAPSVVGRPAILRYGVNPHYKAPAAPAKF